MNKRQRQEKAQRVSEHYQKAEERRRQGFMQILTRRVQEIADQQLRDEYSIVGRPHGTA